MAGVERSHVSSDSRKVKKLCVHCKKDVVEYVKCKKCECFFHPACLRQAAGLKSAVCVHSEETTNEVTPKTGIFEIAAIKAQMNEMMNKIKSLEENEGILQKKIALLEEKVENLQTSKKGKQKLAGKPEETAGNTASIPNPKQCEVSLTSNSQQDTADVGGSNVVHLHRARPALHAGSSSVPAAPAKDSQKENDTATAIVGDKQNERGPNTQGDEMEIGWQVVQRKSKIRRPEPTKGTNENVTQLNVAASRSLAWIFLSGFESNTTEEQIINYLKENGFDGCTCYRMRTKRDRVRSSFKLSIPIQKRNAIMSPELWPSGIIINHFLNLQRRQQQKGVTDKVQI